MSAVNVLVAVGMALLWLLAAVMGLLLLVVLSLLFLPADFAGRVSGEAAPAGGDDPEAAIPSASAAWRLHLRWAWGLVAVSVGGTGLQPEAVASVAGFRVPLRGGRRKRADAGAADGPGRGPPAAEARRRAAAARRKSAGRRRKRRRRTDWQLIWALVRSGARLVGRLWRSGRLRVQGDLTYGFDDPADTGMALAALSVAPLPRQLRLTPAWMDPGLSGWLQMSGRLYLAAVVWAALQVWWEVPVRRRWWPRVKARFHFVRIQTGG